MTRIFSLFILLIACIVTGSATTYSVDEIPNVQKYDSTQYVSNPDGILSAPTVAQLNQMLRATRHATTAEVVIVVVDSIDRNDIDGFATELFQDWGLGKRDKDNGLLILVAKDSRQAAIRPGYGLEGVLPDIICGSILREQMFPKFREGNYDAGILNAYTTIDRILNDPEYAEEIRSAMEDYNSTSAKEDIKDFFMCWFYFALFITAILAIWFATKYATVRNKDNHTKYCSLITLKPVFLICTFMGMGIPAVASIALLLTLNYWRNKPRVCPGCGAKMQKLDEQTDNLYLSPGQDLEEQLGSVDYDVWLCPNCGETDIEPYINNYSTFKPCPLCGVRAYGLLSERIIRRPTNRYEGFGIRTYYCRACGNRHDENYTIRRKDNEDAAFAAGAILGSMAGRGGGGFSGGFGGGGFGGGSTGGGGASGGW